MFIKDKLLVILLSFLILGLSHIAHSACHRIFYKSFPIYEEAREIVRLANITTAAEYRKRYKELGLPSNPNLIYYKKWRGFSKLLGTGRKQGEKKRKEFPSYEEMQEIVRAENITTKREYQARYGELGLPSNPNVFYEEWPGYGECLGTGRKRRKIARKEFPKRKKIPEKKELTQNEHQDVMRFFVRFSQVMQEALK